MSRGRENIQFERRSCEIYENCRDGAREFKIGNCRRQFKLFVALLITGKVFKRIIRFKTI